MPKISKTIEQRQALKEVAEKIKAIQRLNEFVEQASKEYSIVITAKSPAGEPIRYTGEPSEQRINDLLIEYKKFLIQRVHKLARDHRIEFTPLESALLK